MAESRAAEETAGEAGGGPGEPATCIRCGPGAPRRLVFADASGPAARTPLVACQKCGLVFQRDVPTRADLDAGQSLAYGARARRFAGPVEAAVRLFRRGRVQLALGLLPEGGAVLDVGCGRGVFLRHLAALGYRVRGTELSAQTAANALADVPVDVGELVPGRYPPESFDLVSIWHVLEHMRRPDLALQACAQALRPNGALLLAVPNFASDQAAFGGEHWFHLDLPRHLFHFTPSTLEALVTDAGLRVDAMWTGQWEMDPFGWLQTAQNRWGWRHDALYDCLRNHPQARRDLSWAARLGLLALFVPGMLAGGIASAISRLRGSAGTLVVVAKRADAPTPGPRSEPRSEPRSRS